VILPSRLHLEIAAGVLALGVAAYGGSTWLAEHDARLKAESIVQANERVSKDAETKSIAVKNEIADRDRASADREKAMIDAIKNLKTTAQIAPYVQRELAPGAPQPIIVNVPAATKENPSPDATISIPQADLPVLRDRLNKCDVDANALQTCSADADSTKELIRQAGVKLSAAENERDAYKTELKGGVFWRRTKTALKFVGIGGGIAVAATCASGHCK